MSLPLRASVWQLLLLCFVLDARAQEPDKSDPEETSEAVIDVEAVEIIEDSPLPTEFDGTASIRRDRGVNILTARPLRAQSFQLTIDHRAASNFWAGEDAFFDFLGLDGGALKIGLGLRYGILDDLDVGFYRLNDAGIDYFDTYEFDARWRFLRQERHYVDMAVRAGYTWFSQANRGDASGFAGQLFIDRIFFKTLLVGAGFAFHSDSSNDEKSEDDVAYSGAITAVVEWRILTWLAVTGELGARIFGYGSEYPAFSMGLKILTRQHSFSLLVNNSQYTTSDGIVANAWRDFEQLVFGFQIVREFDLR